MRRTLHIGLAVLATSALLVATAGTSSAAGNAIHQAKINGAHGAHHKGGGGTLLASHGGSIERTPVVFIDYWGPQWTAGFSTGGYTSAQAQTYVQGFFGNVGGSPWANSTTQYCEGVASGTTTCPSGTTFVTNPAGELAGVWNDKSLVPTKISSSAIAAEAVAAAAHFGYNANADYMIFTPTGHSTSGFKTTYCAYHSSTSSASGPVSFANMPYQPDAGAACGMNFVNANNNAFGNGYFDGFSIVGGHEFAETVTDPFPNTGWLDGSGAENGDKCAWISSGQGAAQNVSLGGNAYAVQSLWSNAFNSGAGGCVVAYP
ncbi:hypothetical protein EPN29_02660 [bacterium]|nr:MAG: hypothetical protein EPN29_02660 [bacterium]